MKQPHYSLGRVKELVAWGRVWLSRRRALDHFDSPEVAHEFAARVAARLDLQHFAHTVKLAIDIADVYGIRIDGSGWYVKLTIDEEEPEVVFISLHRLERPLMTNSGEVEP